jgi:hypothetical protein
MLYCLPSHANLRPTRSGAHLPHPHELLVSSLMVALTKKLIYRVHLMLETSPKNMAALLYAVVETRTRDFYSALGL